MVQSDIFKIQDAARYLHIHHTTMYRLLKHREVPAFKVGRAWRFDRKELDRWRLARETVFSPQHN